MGLGGKRRFRLIQAQFKFGCPAPGLILAARHAAQAPQRPAEHPDQRQNRSEGDRIARQAVAETGVHVFSGQYAGMAHESARHPPRPSYSEKRRSPESTNLSSGSNPV